MKVILSDSLETRDLTPGFVEGFKLYRILNELEESEIFRVDFPDATGDDVDFLEYLDNIFRLTGIHGCKWSGKLDGNDARNDEKLGGNDDEKLDGKLDGNDEKLDGNDLRNDRDADARNDEKLDENLKKLGGNDTALSTFPRDYIIKRKNLVEYLGVGLGIFLIAENLENLTVEESWEICRQHPFHSRNLSKVWTEFISFERNVGELLDQVKRLDRESRVCVFSPDEVDFDALDSLDLLLEGRRVYRVRYIPDEGFVRNIVYTDLEFHGDKDLVPGYDFPETIKSWKKGGFYRSWDDIPSLETNCVLVTNGDVRLWTKDGGILDRASGKKPAYIAGEIVQYCVDGSCQPVPW